MAKRGTQGDATRARILFSATTRLDAQQQAARRQLERALKVAFDFLNGLGRTCEVAVDHLVGELCRRYDGSAFSLLATRDGHPGILARRRGDVGDRAGLLPPRSPLDLGGTVGERLATSLSQLGPHLNAAVERVRGIDERDQRVGVVGLGGMRLNA